jgi:hypothetical protein
VADTWMGVIGPWCRNVPEAVQAVLQGSAQDLVTEMQAELDRLVYQAPPSPSGYQRTGFLRASLVASTSEMPQLVRDNDGQSVDWDDSGVTLVINGWDGGATLFVGYTARYGLAVAVGARGAVPKPWVQLTVQKWAEIVERRAATVRAAFGL